jgi:hypothetical protein
MYSGTLDDKIENREGTFNGNSYTTLLRETLGYLSRKKKSLILDYELHVPMVMEKKKLEKILKLSGLWRSIYGNIFDVGGIKIRDVKVYTKTNKFYNSSYDINNLEYDYLSSDDSSFEMVKSSVLEKRFPSKTVYEA